MPLTPIINKGSSTPLRIGAVYALVEIGGIWKLRTRSGELYTPRGRYNFVRQGGRLQVSKSGEHIQLSGGNAVDYAGEIQFGYNRSNRGTIKKWTNASGHYQPLTSLAEQAGLPMELFEPIEAF